MPFLEVMNLSQAIPYHIRSLDSDADLDDLSQSKVVTMGNVIEVTTMKKPPVSPPVRKVDADHYVDLRDGLVYEYEHIENRSQSLQSIRRTLARIRALVNTNVTDASRCRWVTLTYKDNMTDPARLYRDFQLFWKRFKRWCSGSGYAVPEYISVVEPQGRGAWHVHAFFIWPNTAPFVDNNDVVARLWRNGFTTTKALSDVDNVGAYFSAYLADMPLDEYQALPDRDQIQTLSGDLQVEEKDFTNAEDLTLKKKFVKGGRLYLYPPGMNIVRKSKGIQDPIVEHMSYSEAKEKASSAKLTFSRSYEVLSSTGVIANVVRKDYYNTKRK